MANEPHGPHSPDLNVTSQVDKFRNFKDAAGFGLFLEITFIIQPDGGGASIAPFFSSYTSYAPYSSTLSFETAKTKIRDHDFMILSLAPLTRLSFIRQTRILYVSNARETTEVGGNPSPWLERFLFTTIIQARMGITQLLNNLNP